MKVTYDDKCGVCKRVMHVLVTIDRLDYVGVSFKICETCAEIVYILAEVATRAEYDQSEAER